MTYDEKVAKAQSIIDTYNSNVGDSQKIDFDAFLNNLKSAGGATEEALAMCTWEDIEDCGGDKKIPRLIARQIANTFRSKPKKESRYVSDKKAAQLSDRELLEHYKPREAGNAVWKRLEALSKGQPFLVYRTDGTLDIDASLSCLTEAAEGEEIGDIYVVNGIPHKVYRLGEGVSKTVAENPLLVDQPLRGAEEACGVTHRSWKAIPHEVRVLIRLALGTDELSLPTKPAIHNVLDLFVGKAPDVMLHTAIQRFPRSKLRYDELQAEGKLPTLKIRRQKKSAGKGRRQDPFYGTGNKTY